MYLSPVYQEEDPIVIDRFDGRALLDDRSKFIKLKGRKKEVDDDEEEKTLDEERYRDAEAEDGEDEQGSGG